MKKHLIALSIVTVALGLSSCSSRSSLAREIEGVWSGTPESIFDNSALSATLIETYQFDNLPAEESGTVTGGSVNIVGMLTATVQLVVDEFEQPLSFTSSARSSIIGTWDAIEDDEIALNLNLTTLNIVVDPDAVIPGSALMNDNGIAKIEQMKPEIINMIASGLKQSLSKRYSSMKKLDDIEIDGSTLKFESGKIDYTFSRQGVSI